MINTFCPRCNNPLTFEDSHAGMQGQCNKCNSVLTVPSPAPAGFPTSQQQYYSPPPAAQQGANGMGIASFVISLIALFILGVILGPLSVILGLVALKHPKKGLAIAGVVIGSIATIGAIIILILVASGTIKFGF
jgi:hypothetical protein